MKTTVSSKGQIIIPAELRARDRIRPGESFEIKRLKAGQYLLKKMPAQSEYKSVLEWLLDCPSHDWFQPIKSESTDSIRPT